MLFPYKHRDFGTLSELEREALEKSDQTRKWEEERMELIKASGSGGTVLFWIGGTALAICVMEAWINGASFISGFGFAASIGLLIWAMIEHDKKASANRKIEQLDAYLSFTRTGRPSK